MQLQTHRDYDKSSALTGTVRQGLAGLQLEVPQQPGSSEQGSGSPFSSGTSLQPWSLDCRVLAYAH